MAELHPYSKVIVIKRQLASSRSPIVAVASSSTTKIVFTVVWSSGVCSIGANSLSRLRGTTEHIERAALGTDQQTSTRKRAPAPTNDGRHEGPTAVEAGAATRSEEPRQERPLEPEVTDRAVRNERPQDNGAVNSGGQTQPMVGKKERSTARSAAIIVGAAAAGAAIGAASGGGKGAAIGAISGGAGGYVYDRMTRRKAVPAMPTITNSHSDTDQSADGPRYDRAPSLALRFGTPTFN